MTTSPFEGVVPEAPGQDRGEETRLAAELVFDTEDVRAALEVGRTGLWRWDGETRILEGDHGFAALWGLPSGELLTTAGFLASIHKDDAARVQAEIGATLGPAPEALGIEFRISRRGDGGERWIALHGRRHGGRRPGGGTTIVGMARDVTTRHKRDDQVHSLMREVTHRSKNLLAIIQAMARQTVKDSMTAAEFEERFSSRLKGLAISHDLLAARDWHGAPIRDLVRSQLGAALDRAGPRVTTEGPALFLRPEAAQNIGLAVNELASNASRFGALSVPTGTIAVRWAVDPPGSSERRLHLTWREFGGPEVSPPSRQGFGHKVVERLAARALDGHVELSFAASGLEWSLHIPASFVIEGEDAAQTN